MTDVLRGAEGRPDGAGAEERLRQSSIQRWPGHWTAPARESARQPDEAALDAELMGQLWLAIAALPDSQQAVLTLRDIQGYSAEEVCGLLGLQPGNQRVLLHRARATVRTSLEPYLAAA